MKKNKINAIWIALILICLSAFNQRASAECPTIGATWTLLNEDRHQGYITNGTGIECCLHTLSIRVIYTLDGGDYVEVHGAMLRNDSTGVASGDTNLTVYAFGDEQVVARVGGPGNAGAGPNTQVRVMAVDVGGEMGGSCNGMTGYGAYCNANNVLVVDNGSVNLRLKFGQTSLLDGPDVHKGLLWVGEEYPSALLTSPSSLNYALSEDSSVDVVRYADRTIRQIRGEDGLLDIVPLDEFGYEIRLYASAAVGNWNGEQYKINARPHYVWKIHNPDRDPSNQRLRIEEHAQGFGEDVPPVIHEYVWNEADEAWILTLGDGLSQDRKQVTWNADRTMKTELQEILDPETGNITRRIERVYGQIHLSDPRMFLLNETNDPGPTKERTEYTYIDDPQSINFGRKSTIQYHDGNWKAFTYDDQGRVTYEHNPWLNSPISLDAKQNRVLHYEYKAPKKTIDTGHEPWRPRVVIETIQGHEVSRTYRLISESEEWTIRCAEPGAKWDERDNLITKTSYITEGLFSEKPSRVEHSDGTVTTYHYQIENDRRIKTVSHGIISNKKSAELTEGTCTITITGSAGQLYETHTQDIATSLTLDRTLYSEHDAFQRPERIDYHDGTYERVLHDCCGPSQKRDREGRWTNLVFDSLKRPVYEITDTETKIIQYNAAGDVTEIKRLNAQTQTLETIEKREYDLKGNQILNDKKGRQQRTLLTSNPLEIITENPDGTNHIETRAIDGQLLTITGTAVHGIRYAHAIEKDERHHVRTETEILLDTLGNDTEEWNKTYYDALNRPYKTERADGAQSHTTYNERGQLISQTDPDGVTALYLTDPLGKVRETVIDMNQNGKIDYKGNDRITRIEHHIVEIEGVVYTQTQTYQWQTEKEEEPTLVSETLQSTDGLISQQTLFPSETKWLSTTIWTEETPGDPASASTINPVHPVNLVKKQTTHHPDGTQTIQTFERTLLITEQRLGSDDNQISRVDYTYDVQNRLIAQTDAYSGTTEFKYDDQGRTTVMIKPAPEEGAERPITRFTYDEMDRVISIQHPDGTKTQSSYWPTGELKRKWGSRQYPVEYGYDYAGRKKTMMTWQDFKNDRGKAVTRWIYDRKSGHLISKRYQDGLGPDYRYTRAGRLKTRIWARGAQTDYNYNSAGDLEKVNYEDKETPDVSYKYDRLGRRIETNQGKDYVEQLEYDDLGRVTSETVTQPGVETHTLTRIYNDAGKSGGYHWKMDDNVQTVNYTYNKSGHISRVTDGDFEVTYEYLANTHQIEHIIYQYQGEQTMRTTKKYDRHQHLLDTTTRRLGDFQILSSQAYDYNQANQRTMVTDESGSVWKYEFDELGQVTAGRRMDNASHKILNNFYQYDTIGNRKKAIAQTVPGTERVETKYSVNLLNQYDQIQTKDSAEPMLTLLHYDEDGNLIQDDQWIYEWNAENRLVAMEGMDADNSKRLEFRYDPQGRRIVKEVYEPESKYSSTEKDKKKTKWNLIKQYQYIYDGWNLIAEIDGDGKLFRTHLWGIDLSGYLQGAGGVGGLLKTSNHRENKAAIPLFDGNGNVVQYIDCQDDNQFQQFKFDPFGTIIRDNTKQESIYPFQFSTKFADVETGFSYYGFRYYNPETGRWLNRDPIGELGGISIQSFLSNNPINGVDHLGMIRWWDVLKGSMQAFSGAMMWAAILPTEVGTGGLATPVAVGMATWGTLSIINGVNTVIAAIGDQVAPEAIQVQSIQNTYEYVTGDELGPNGLRIVRIANAAVDITVCGGAIRGNWVTISQSNLFLKTYTSDKLVTRSSIALQQVTSNISFNWRLHNFPLAGQVVYDYYGLFSATYEVTENIIE